MAEGCQDQLRESQTRHYKVEDDGVTTRTTNEQVRK